MKKNDKDDDDDDSSMIYDLFAYVPCALIRTYVNKAHFHYTEKKTWQSTIIGDVYIGKLLTYLKNF